MIETCFECSKHSFGLCGGCQEQDFAEMEVFGGIMEAAEAYGVIPKELPETVVDFEEWVIALMVRAGVDESITDYWTDNLNKVREWRNA